MNLFQQSLKVFIKNKFLWIALSALLCFNFGNILYFIYLEGFGNEMTLLSYTGNILFLSPQILVAYLVVSYEYFSEIHRENIEECIAITPMGARQAHRLCGTFVMALALFFHYAVLTAFDLLMTGKAFAFRGITEAASLWAPYIVGCLFVNIFLIGLIGIFLGVFLSKIAHRILAYSVIFTVAFAASYLLENIASLVLSLTDFTVNLFSLLEPLNIMTPGLKFLPNTGMGFPLPSYRIFLILFWIAFLILLILLRDSRKKVSVKTGLCLCLCIAFFAGYALPASKVDMSLNKQGTAMADQYYYEDPEHHIPEVAPDFSVDKYTMELDVGRLMEASVTMDLSHAKTRYRFTLSHSSEIQSITDGEGRPLDFERKGDGLLINNSGKNNKRMIVRYKGTNEAYYANAQGMNLRGSYPYYPIPGYRKVSEEGMFINPLFLTEESEFDIRVNAKKRVFCNLPEKEKGHFTGVCRGATLLSGLYTEKEKNGVRIVYPIFNGWNDENLEDVSAAVRKKGYEGCQVFITPNVNRQDDAISEEQIITRNYFTSVDEDLFIPENS